ncbi:MULTISPECIES: DUF2177 family protein [unclassified Pseudomonas]|jgi:uncharacterized membrane protein|uniref:DUF2177 family protein n=1 Tax=unclassified Pseudomonas TaxID=196821 RepID=UPI001055D710|nr:MULTISPECIES: DUF2177 family protein [unclassified Pseudomonas]MBW3506891.1 DUF2177 family protein [Pseudomonas sp. NKUCC02_KPG]MEC4167079.1 DUF2177 family protein [Pseudomonas sp. MS-1(2024)]MEC4240430.1 DUF2177 family protein [Pseudomonas sp. DSV-1]
MSKAVWAYIGALLAFLVLDGLWLGVLMSSTYKELLGSLMLAQPKWGPAIVFYLMYVLGVVFFVVLPALARASARRAALAGAFFGLVAYGTYDMTNWATLQGWSAQLALMDMAWGGLLTCLASLSGYWTARKLAS